MSHRLAEKDHVHYSKGCVSLRKLVAEHMTAINERELGEEKGDFRGQSVSAFFKETYYPWVKANKKHSTSLSYGQIWAQHLEKHFEGKTLSEYKTSDASRFLTGLADTGLGRNAISHVRSLMSGIFSLAVNLGTIDRNPLREAKVLSKMKPPAKTESYSLREVEDMISALVDRPDAQLLISLCGFLGLRPSEASGLKWDDVDLEQGVIHLRRGVVRGVVGDLKTVGSATSLPIIDPIRVLLTLLLPTKRTWLLENNAGNPKDLKDATVKVIKPAIAKWNASHEEKIVWKGLYAFRRTAASLLWSLTGSTQASQQVLRHASPATTVKHYLKADRTHMERGLKMLEAKLAERK